MYNREDHQTYQEVMQSLYEGELGLYEAIDCLAQVFGEQTSSLMVSDLMEDHDQTDEDIQ